MAELRAPAIGTIHRGTLFWLLICEVLVMIPFASSHPAWLIIMLILCLLWRFRALQRGELKPPRLLIYAAVFGGLGILYASGFRQYDIDSMVAIVLLGFVLKVLETWRQRDTLILVFCGYFLCAAHFIYSQSPWQALFTVVTVIALSACACSAHRPASTSTWKAVSEPLRLASTMILLSAPLAVLLFISVPRIPPLWSIPQQNHATTGLIDEIAPGDIAQLVRSGKDAFRVEFNGATPQREDWYWRALVFQDFDGHRWTPGAELPAAEIPQSLRQQANYRYRIMMEPSGQQWIPVLDTPTAFDRRRINYQQTRTLVAESPINAVAGYVISSNSNLPARFRPNIEERRQSLQLPSQGNTRLRDWAINARATVRSDAEFVEHVLRYIRNEQYFYTLRPPVLPTQSSQDAFWFDSKQGFCSHYASAFAFVMRSVGIPARLVGGYLGGRYNEADNFITVRQMDAHAWVEVLLPEQGWVRVDPTAAVAPERVRQDLSDVFADTPDFVAELAGRTRAFVLTRSVQLWLDAFEYNWQRWVVQFDEDSRAGLFDKLLGQKNILLQTALLLLTFAGIAGCWVLLLSGWTYKSRRNDAAKYLFKLERKLAKHGVRRRAGDTVGAFLRRAERQLPAQKVALRHFAQVYYALEYSNLNNESRRKAMANMRKQSLQFSVA